MKSIFLILFLALSVATSCKKDAVTGKGCLTGLYKGGSGDRIFIRCCTQAEYQAGSNVTAGGTSDLGNYTSIQWTPIDNCASCH